MVTTLYALHGFLGLEEDWKWLFRESSLQSQLKTISLLEIEKPCSLNSWADTFNRDVSLDSSGKRILMGYSLGGRLAIHALIKQPHLWDAAVIISAHPGLTSDRERKERAIIDENWAGRFENEKWNVLMQSWNKREAFAGDTFAFERLEEHYIRSDLATTIRNWSLSTQENLLPQISSLSLPILWIAGQNDRYDFLENRLTFNHQLSKLWFVPESGHRAPWEQSQLFMHQLSQFLNEINIYESSSSITMEKC